jgi:cellulose synthase/poly-beta-1,6-N-acetylglucosamine synthase-like glycosyltransferase
MSLNQLLLLAGAFQPLQFDNVSLVEGALWLLTSSALIHGLALGALTTRAAVIGAVASARPRAAAAAVADEPPRAPMGAPSVAALILVLIAETWLLLLSGWHWLLANALGAALGIGWAYVHGRWPVRLAPGPFAVRLPRAGRIRLGGGAALNRLSADWAYSGMVLAVALAFVSVAVAGDGAWATAAVVLLGVAAASRIGVSFRQAVVMLLASILAVSAVSYFTWRFEQLNWTAVWVAMPLFIAEAFGAVHILGLQQTVWPRPDPVLNPRIDPSGLPLFIFIPTVNEGASVLAPTIHGALAASWAYQERFPHARVEIVICNDGRVAGYPHWQDAELLAERYDVRCVTRTVGGGAKAGNIEYVRQQLGATGDALLAIFDADQVAEPRFFLETIPPFADESVGWVQTGQYYRNVDNPVAEWANDQQRLFYKVLCPAKAALNSAFICGTNVVIRAAALDEIGGLPQTSVTEDFVASIELHPRWRSVFLQEQLAYGLGPMDLKEYLRQQRRWAVGTLGVLRSHWKQIFIPGYGGLDAHQRVQYALACSHYLCGIRDLVYIVAPLVFLYTGIPAVRGSNLPTFLAHFLPYWLASQVAFWYVAWGKTGLRGIVMGFASFPALVMALATVIRGRRVDFTITSKFASLNRSLGPIIPHLVAFGACLIGLAAAARAGLAEGSVTVSALWVVYTTLMLSGVLWLGLAGDRLPEQLARLRTVLASALSFRRVRALAPGGGLIAATLLMMVWIGIAPVAFSAEVHPAALADHVGHPMLGLSLPTDLLRDRPPELTQELDLDFGLVGRTQVIGDRFDRDWATSLASRGQIPWLTLLFGVPGATSFEASLPAITNGMHDQALHRWAQDIRDYGRPVYITILPQVDRNWTLSSAVTNGGIPQDVPRAWAHVQTIFKQDGAVNAAWIWGPADPADDQPYTPPASAIDAVRVDLIHYPDTPWPDAEAVLQSVVDQHPDMPIMLEVSAAGDQQQRAAWLRELGSAVADTPGIFSLVYHEGSPDPHPTAEENDAWAIAHDPLAIQAFREAAEDAGIARPETHRAGATA